jgi:hypothetical protein
MKRAMVAAVLALGVALPAFADITIKQTTGGSGLGMSKSAPGTTYIKGHKMRTDVVMGDRTLTSIYDVDAQKLYSFDSKKKEADVWDMATFAQELSQSIDVSSATGGIKANGQTKLIGGQTANGYDMNSSINAAMGGNKEMMMTVTATGQVWIVKDAPGAADYAKFYTAAAEKGFIFTDPRAAKGQPGQAKAMAQMYKEMALLGIPYDMQMQMKIGGSGPLAAVMSRLGNITFTIVTESVTVDPLADDLFAPPAGYKLNTRK